MEAFAVLVGFLILVAFGLALIGVPILFSRIKALTSRVVLLEQRLAAQASRTVVDAPALTTPVVDLGETKSESVEAGSTEASVPEAVVQSKPVVETNIETPESDDSENFDQKKMKASWASP